jgi:hypothetical protein
LAVAAKAGKGLNSLDCMPDTMKEGGTMGTKRTAKQIEQSLHGRGFDISEGRHVRCSQCQAMVINGHACHETGCPNIVREQDNEFADEDFDIQSV